jgi:hypothetical protein
MLSWMHMRATFGDRPALGHALCCAPGRLRSYAFALAMSALACGGAAAPSALEGWSAPSESTAKSAGTAAAAPDPSSAAANPSPAAAASGGAQPAVTANAAGTGRSGGAPGDTAGSGSASTAGAAGSSGAAPVAVPPPALAEGEVQGRYSVPVAPELEGYATFDVPAIRIRQHGSEIEIAYTLPALLVGGDEELSFRGSGSADANGVYQLSGDRGQARCQWLEAAFVCDEALRGVEIDRNELQREYADLPAAESDARWSIATQFSDDPIGKLTFPR